MLAIPPAVSVLVEVAPREEAISCESRQEQFGKEKKRERTVVVHGLGEALLSFLEHLGVDVEHGDARVPVSVLCAGVIEDAHRNVAGSACDVEALESALGVEFRDVVVLPESVDAKGHGIVHDIVRGRDGREDAADWQEEREGGQDRVQIPEGGSSAEWTGELRTEVFLFGFWDIPIAKVSGRAAAAGARSWLRIERSSRLSASGLRGRKGPRE